VLGGVIVDASGRPMSGAKVFAVPKTTYLRRLEQRPILGPDAWLTVETDGQGGFRLDSFAADVSSDFWVEAPGRSVVYTYTPQRLTVSGFEAGRTDIRLVLPDEVAVRGRVVHARSGDPVADARLILRPDTIRDEHEHPYLPTCATSGQDGRFAFTGIPTGWHYVDVSVPYETGLVDRRVRFEVRSGQGDVEITASLADGGTIELVAREEATKQAIRDLPVYFWEAAQDEQSNFYKDVQTGVDGVLRIRAPAGLCKFSACLDGYSPLWYEGQVFVTADQTAKSQVVLRRYPLVSGLVVDESGSPVGGAAVNDGATDEAGRFEVPFPSEESSFRVWIARHVRDNLAAVVNVERDDKPVRIVLRPALIVTGRVTDPNGIEIPAARVGLHVRAADGLTPCGHEMITDSQGRFTIRAVVPGGGDMEYRISVNVAGYGARLYGRIAIEGEPGTTVAMEPIVLLPADRSVTGIVVGPDGNPMAGIPIAVHGRDQPSRYAATDGDGRFVVTRVCRAPLRIQAGFSSVREETGTLQAQGGDRDVQVVLGTDGVHLSYASLVGKPLPIEGLDALSQARGTLLCLFDWQQRPSRNMVIDLAKRAEEFTRRNVAVVGVQTAKADRTEFDKWIADKHIAFPVRTIVADERTMRLTWGVQSLPWLILVNRAHIVTAEGPQLAAIERQIGESGEKEK